MAETEQVSCKRNMQGLTVNNKHWIWVVPVVLILIAGIVDFFYSQPQDAPDSHVDVPIERDDPAPNIAGQSSLKVVKETRQTTEEPRSAIPLSPESYSYPAEQEGVFIEEVMEDIPLMIEVEVHRPGVIYFRREPDWPENLDTAMEEMAHLYKNRLGYEGPVNVVFFISGRPAQSKVFFRE